jgi:hypothetical protein
MVCIQLKPCSNCFGIKIPLMMLVVLLVANFLVKAQDVVDATTLVGKYMFGYQGWQRATGDGCNRNWSHWTLNGSIPTGTNMNVDIFPDVSEFPSSELYPTSMHYSNGSTVSLYSTCNDATIQRHFKWMKDYGLDGVWAQRFGPKNVGWTQEGNKVILSCKKGAETYGRVFAIMYDITGASDATLFNNLTSDWMYLVDTFKVTQSSRYLNHKGKPIVAIWGWGFPDRQMTAATATQLTTWFHTGAAAKYQATVLAGVISDGGTSWLNLSDPWATAIRTADVISPWFVGSFGGTTGADGWTKNRVVPDIAECNKLGIDYLPVVWPGFSWSNMHSGSTPLNQFPRAGGAFLWNQVYNYINAGATMIYNAMFDEIDEGTAMLKICPKRSLAPVEGQWVVGDIDGYANLPSDWYLQIAGYAKRTLVKQMPLSKTMPINPSSPTQWTGTILENKVKIQEPLKYRFDRTNGVLYFDNVNNENNVVSIFQANGEKKLTIPCSAKRGELQIPLYSQGILPNGVYVVTIRNGSKQHSEPLVLLRQ